MMNVVIGEEVIIDPAVPATIPLYRRPSLNKFVRYDVDLNKRTCGYEHSQHYGCRNAILA